MTKTPPPPPAAGGSYTVDPKTGSYSKVAGTEPPVPGPAPRPEAAPTTETKEATE